MNRKCLESSWAVFNSIFMNNKSWFPPMRLTYSHKNKLISLMRLLFYSIKMFNLIRSHQISQISHFRIKYEYSVFHLKEKNSRHAFFFLTFSLYPLLPLSQRQGNIRFSSAILSFSFKYDLTIFPKLLEYI